MIPETWIQKITLPDGQSVFVLQPLGLILGGPREDIHLLSVREQEELRGRIENHRKEVVIEEFR